MKRIMRFGKALIAPLFIPLLIIVAVIIGFVLVRKVFAEPVDTYHSSWHLIRTLDTEDAADFATALALATNAGDFDSIPSDAFRITSHSAGIGPHEGMSPGGAWMLVFGCSTTDTDDDSETFSFTLVGWAKTNGMAQVICEGDGAAGTQDVVTYPGASSATDANDTWADTLNLDETTKWPSVAVYNASGDNEVAILVFDTTGLEYIYPFIYDAAGTAEATAVAVYGRRY
jgi:hypothetical protein